ncbi:hypothetical protein ACF1FX_33580 [Streptomyces sp. NPDC014646]|uniref:hypothetical protein n=1 Tax=Streptomyces sp. NPDC014646 TaxID=3364877 RepID=UPI0037003BB6
MDDDKAGSSKLVLAEGLLRAEFQRQVMADPQQALETVSRLVLGMHTAVSTSAIDAALKSGVTWHEIGRALASLEGAGLLLRQAAVLLLGLPAADRAAEQEMLAQLSEDATDAEDTAQDVEDVRTEHPEDVWAAAVLQFQQNTRPVGLSSPASQVINTVDYVP